MIGHVTNTPIGFDPLQRLLALYPAIGQLPAALRDAVLAHPVPFIEAPAGTLLFDEGKPCQGFPLVLSGCVRVARGSPQGRWLELYRVQPGELCVVSASCLLGRADLVAHGQATQRTELFLLDQAGFDRWCGDDGFRTWVFAVFAQRLADLMSLAEAVSFQRLDQRLAQALLGHGPARHITHQALADELGTVREMVSRLLSRFERAGWVRLGRERIELLDPLALRNLSQGGRPSSA
jgi:CRP/FNR family transcriptional regulator, anaerobic regulatory protein